MSRYREPVLKRCRYLGISPTVIGIDKESNRKKSLKRQKKVSEYAIQLKESAEQARSANEAKTRFLFNMSDGNYVYITLYKLSSIDEYLKNNEEGLETKDNF